MKIPSRLQVATKAFFAILRQKPHVYCDNKVRSLYGSDLEFHTHMSNLIDLYKQSKETNDWMNNIKNILNEKI